MLYVNLNGHELNLGPKLMNLENYDAGLPLIITLSMTYEYIPFGENVGKTDCKIIDAVQGVILRNNVTHRRRERERLIP